MILGIDPGSYRTGYGVIAVEGRRQTVLAQGVVRAPRRGGLGDRLRTIYTGVAAQVRCHVPDEVAVEQVFVNRNPATALILGQARGAALAAALVAGCVLAEYTPRAVKLAVVGSGGADKRQVAHMVRHLLGLAAPIAEDASDALAVALCHAHSRELGSKLVLGA